MMNQQLVADMGVIERIPVVIPVPGSIPVEAFRPSRVEHVIDWYESATPAPDDFWRIVASFYEPRTEAVTIEDLEQGYTVVRPIPVEIECLDEGLYLASFRDANIAITGSNAQDAYQGLVAEILDTFDTLSTEQHLSGAAAAQLEILRTYIVQA